MKKLILTLLFIILMVNTAPSQKVTFTLENPTVSGSYFQFNLMANIPAGQVWKVGASNIRVNFVSTPPNMLSVKADNPAFNANSNISNGNGYMAMTTTSVATGAAIGCNILTFNTSGFYQFTTGSYLICTLRWNILGGFTNAAMTFRVPPQQFPSIVFDSTVQLIHPGGFNTVNPLVTSNINLMTEIPKEFGLYQNYPNPFNPMTKIEYAIPKQGFVSLKIYDLLGREVANLVNGEMAPSYYRIDFNGSNLSSGVYFYRLQSGSFINTKRMVLIK